jgi:hypothetical protein
MHQPITPRYASANHITAASANRITACISQPHRSIHASANRITACISQSYHNMHQPMTPQHASANDITICISQSHRSTISQLPYLGRCGLLYDYVCCCRRNSISSTTPSAPSCLASAALRCCSLLSSATTCRTASCNGCGGGVGENGVRVRGQCRRERRGRKSAMGSSDAAATAAAPLTNLTAEQWLVSDCRSKFELSTQHTSHIVTR